MQWFIEQHDLGLVGLSYLVSVTGALVSLYIANYITDPQGRFRPGWLILASIVFGGCAIWAMHFVGMLAYEMSMPAAYGIRNTLLSALLPIVLSGLGFFIAFRWRDSIAAWLAAGALLGGGVAAMHYLGMAALRMNATMTHDALLTGIAVAIAVVAATAALRIVVHWKGLKRIASPLIMGLAVCGMHYTAMAGMQMVPGAASSTVRYFEGAWSADFMGFTAGLVVFLALLIGSAFVVFQKAMDLEPEFATS